MYVNYTQLDIHTFHTLNFFVLLVTLRSLGLYICGPIGKPFARLGVWTLFGHMV